MKQVVACFLFIVFFACREQTLKPLVTGLESKPISDFNILLSDSTTYFNTTTSLRAGRKTVLFYYSPTCPYCRAQMREIVNNIERYKNVQLLVITGADFKSMKDFNTYFKLENYPNVITGIDTGNVMVKVYQAYGVPFTAFFDEQQRMIAAYSGRITGRTLLQATNP